MRDSDENYIYSIALYTPQLGHEGSSWLTTIKHLPPAPLHPLSLRSGHVSQFRHSGRPVEGCPDL